MNQKITFGFKVEEQVDFGFPYISQKRADGTNHGYADLKRQPDLLGTIPELAGWTELEEIVRQLNEPGSVFKTVGCDAGAVACEFDTYSQKVGCYIHIAFDEFEFNTKQSYYDLVYSGLYYHAQDFEIVGRVHVLGTLKPTRFQDFGGRLGYTLSLDVSGLGNNVPEGRAAWSEAMPILADAFKRLSDGWETFKLQAEV